MMRTRLIASAVAVTVALGGVTLGLSACAPAAPTAVSTAVPTPLPKGVTVEGVVLAAYLLTNGDIQKAVAGGLVTPAEVDLARTAIAKNELDAWVAAAKK